MSIKIISIPTALYFLKKERILISIDRESSVPSALELRFESDLRRSRGQIFSPREFDTTNNYFRIKKQGSGFKVSGFQEQGFGFRVQVSGFQEQSSSFRFQSFKFRERFREQGSRVSS